MLPPIPQKKPRTPNKHAREIIKSGPLQGWMRDFALWLALYEGKPTREEQRAKLQQAAHGQKITMQSLVRLRERQDFQQYLSQLMASEEAIARAKLVHDSPEYIDARRRALRQAETLAIREDVTVREKAALLKTISSLTEPLVDRVWPRREDKAEVQPTVIINLGSPTSFAQRHLSAPDEIPAIEYEVLNDDPDDPE
jgi:hypothetical protein